MQILYRFIKHFDQNPRYMQSVKDRLKEFLQKTHVKERAFCRAIGVSSGYVSAMSKSIQPDKLQRISMQYPQLNTSWLLTGEGEMLKDQDIENAHDISNNEQLMKIIESQQQTIENLSNTLNNLTNK